MRPSRAEALQILGLDRIAGRVDPARVKAAYRQLARHHHPDHGGDAATFQQVQAAYEVLRDSPPGVPRRQAPRPAPSVTRRWWESSARWHEGEVDTSGIDWSAAVPPPPVRLDRERLAVLLAGEWSGPGEGRVAPVLARSRAPGALLNRVIGWLQPDLLASLEARPSVEGEGSPGHDVTLGLTARSVKARRVVGNAGLPPGWVKQRTSSSVTVTRAIRPSPGVRETAARITGVVVALLEAIEWPLGDWYVVADRDAPGRAAPRSTR